MGKTNAQIALIQARKSMQNYHLDGVRHPTQGIITLAEKFQKFMDDADAKNDRKPK